MFQLKEKFDTYMGVKTAPNAREKALFERAEKYINYLSYIPGIQMIAVVNSLSMHATHADSDIDLFIITRPGSIWFVRLFATALLWILGVWRHGADIAGNICLSFFITTDAMNLENIAIEKDIYLFYWIYYMKPVYDVGGVFEAFIKANKWTEEYIIPETKDSFPFSIGGTRNLPYQETNRAPFRGDDKNEERSLNGHGDTYSMTVTSFSLNLFNTIIRFFLLPRTQRSFEKLGKPDGIIISDSMLKFHDTDRRKEIRDAIL